MPVYHIVVNVALVGAAALVGLVLSRRRPLRWVGVLSGAAAVAVSVYFIKRPDVFAGLARAPWVVWYSNLYPIGAALMIPSVIAIGHSRRQRVRLAALSMLLAAVALWPSRFYLAGPSHPDDTGADWLGRTRQSTDESCSAAAMVTLLHYYGIRTTERDVAGLAETRQGKGTIALGRYRAMKVMADQSKGRFKVDFRTVSVEQLLAENSPAVISVGIGRFLLDPMERQLCREANWSPGRSHSVVYVGRDPFRPDHVVIMDPGVGYEHWPIRDLRTLFQGEMIRLVKAG